MASQQIFELESLVDPSAIAVRMRSVDWTTTALGPPEHWSASLKTIVQMMLKSRFAMWMA
jgi:hypothetical protein